METQFLATETSNGAVVRHIIVFADGSRATVGANHAGWGAPRPFRSWTEGEGSRPPIGWLAEVWAEKGEEAALAAQDAVKSACGSRWNTELEAPLKMPEIPAGGWPPEFYRCAGNRF